MDMGGPAMGRRPMSATQARPKRTEAAREAQRRAGRTIGPREVVSALVATALCGAAMWLWQLHPHLEANMQEPLQTHGRIGQVVKNDVFSVRVDRFDVTTSLTKRFATTAQRTDGVFLIVHLRARAERKPYTMGHARLVTPDGLEYKEGGRTGITADASETYQPMLWSAGSLLFELPKDRLAGARMVVGVSDPLNQLSAESVIDLGIDKAKAAQLATRPLTNYELGD
jgi:hypothetical protein